MADRRLHHIRSEVEMLQPWDIPTRLFGKDRVVGTQDGQYVTVKKRRGFLLSCAHLIIDREEIGGFCGPCQIDAELINHPYPEWKNLVCHRCFRRCSEAFCPNGLCQVHAGLSHDSKWLCPAHHQEGEEQLWFSQVEERRGWFAARALRGFVTLFLGRRAP